MTVDIRNEDCRETLKSLSADSVDVILTSPFYNTNRSLIISDRGSHPPEGRYDVHVDGMSSEEYVAFTLEIFNGFNKVLKPNGVVLYNINYGTENTTDLFLVISNLIERSAFTVADVICWKKRSALPNNVSSNKLTRIWEFVFVLCRKTEFDTFYMNKRVVSHLETGQALYENKRPS